MRVISSVIVGLVSCVVVFSLGEMICQYWVGYRGDALDRTRSILQLDERIGWKQRSELNTSFLGIPLRTNSLGWRAPEITARSDRPRILILGPSSTFGWGVPESDTYASRLGEMLASEVINAGEIGYSTEQGRIMFDTDAVRALAPHVVVIAYGVNDTDRYRFALQSDRTDRAEFSASHTPFSIWFSSMVRKSALLSEMERLALSLRDFTKPPLLAVPPDMPFPSNRVPPKQFEENLRALIAGAHERGARVILLTTATDLSYTPPPADALAAYAAGVESWQRGDVGAARTSFEKAGSSIGDVHYYLSAIAAAEGDTTRARDEFAAARDREPERVARDVAVYNAIVRRVAREEHVPLGDIETWFSGQRDLFVDPIHFSAKGHEIVGRGLAGIIEGDNLLQ